MVWDSEVAGVVVVGFELEGNCGGGPGMGSFESNGF